MTYDDRKREAGTNPDEWIESEPLNGDRLADEAADTEGHMPRVRFGVQPGPDEPLEATDELGDTAVKGGRVSFSDAADEPVIEPDEAGRFRG